MGHAGRVESNNRKGWRMEEGSTRSISPSPSNSRTVTMEHEREGWGRGGMDSLMHGGRCAEIGGVYIVRCRPTTNFRKSSSSAIHIRLRKRRKPIVQF